MSKVLTANAQAILTNIGTIEEAVLRWDREPSADAVLIAAVHALAMSRLRHELGEALDGIGRAVDGCAP